MREELERHLRDAGNEGRSVESVTGPDVLGFAEEWAREYRPASAIPRPISGVGPGLLALGSGILNLLALLGIGLYSGGGTTVESCCPRRVVESGTGVITGGILIWLFLVFAAGILSIVAAVLLFRGRLRKGGWAALAGAPLALVTPWHVFAAGLLAGAGAWALSRARRSEAPVQTS
jgi:hypothetical protein